MSERHHLLIDRLIALIIDTAIVFTLAWLISMRVRPLAFSLNLIIGAAYQWYFLCERNGQTPGKRLMGLRVVNIDGTSIQPIEAILRYAGYYINTMLVIGWFWAAIREDGRGIQDLLGRTIVVRTSY